MYARCFYTVNVRGQDAVERTGDVANDACFCRTVVCCFSVLICRENTSVLCKCSVFRWWALSLSHSLSISRSSHLCMCFFFRLFASTHLVCIKIILCNSKNNNNNENNNKKHSKCLAVITLSNIIFIFYSGGLIVMVAMLTLLYGFAS